MPKITALLLLIIFQLGQALNIGDTVPDMQFQELKFNADGSVDTLDQSLYSILEQGRTVIIYYFNITYS